ncbi:MAG: DNA alkylation repair protein [Candidatus Pacebacteria bacterium]|nr:DNA alkylation repair protein [Candidatus Paceibacterota bacterium]
MSKTKNLLREVKLKEDKNKSQILVRFFKTGKGEYGEGDKFLGITVPESRKLAQKYSDLDFKEIEKLIKNKYHEIRLIAILILVHKYKNINSSLIRSNKIENKEKIVKFYLKNTKYINNWDLVDLSSHYILGDYLFHNKTLSKKILEKLAKSKNLWERRIAIVSTFAFIYKGQPDWTFKIVKILLNDKEDLIHKACGWMLREVGKRISKTKLKEFLDFYEPRMPRTMLRYSIERFSKEEREIYLNKKTHRSEYF